MRSRALLDRRRRIEREVLAVASCNQLYADRLAFMQRYRHDGAGQAEHVDRGNETQIVPEQFARALRADGVLARAGRRLHRRRREHDREILEEQLPGPDMAVAGRRGAHPAQQIERVCLRLDAAPGGMEIRRRHFQHRGFLQYRGFVGDDVAPGLPDTVDVGNVDLADAVARTLEMVGGLPERSHAPRGRRPCRQAALPARP